MALCFSQGVTPNSIKRSKRKYQTWKFAGEFLIRKSLTEDQASLGRWTRDRLIDLGPTFIKLGQIASARSDLYPIDFIKQLESLQGISACCATGPQKMHSGRRRRRPDCCGQPFTCYGRVAPSSTRLAHSHWKKTNTSSWRS